MSHQLMRRTSAARTNPGRALVFPFGLDLHRSCRNRSSPREIRARDRSRDLLPVCAPPTPELCYSSRNNYTCSEGSSQIASHYPTGLQDVYDLTLGCPLDSKAQDGKIFVDELGELLALCPLGASETASSINLGFYGCRRERNCFDALFEPSAGDVIFKLVNSSLSDQFFAQRGAGEQLRSKRKSETAVAVDIGYPDAIEFYRNYECPSAGWRLR